jgi:hypothetical protein
MNPKPEPAEVYEWLRDRAAQTNVNAVFHTHLARTDHNWIYLPVSVKGGDIFDKAQLLQQLEDAWRNQATEPYWELLLIPTPADTASKTAA